MRAPTLLGDIVCQRFGHYAFGKISPGSTFFGALAAGQQPAPALCIVAHLPAQYDLKNRPQPGKKGSLDCSTGSFGAEIRAPGTRCSIIFSHRAVAKLF
jgi:hypothetical protein